VIRITSGVISSTAPFALCLQSCDLQSLQIVWVPEVPFTSELDQEGLCDEQPSLGVSIFAVAVGLAVIWVMASAPKSSAIPAFSRKYQTSCTTCHNNYPELNDFGEAFKKNGFKFPKDDETPFLPSPMLLPRRAPPL